jgi:hypothetical protein
MRYVGRRINWAPKYIDETIFDPSRRSYGRLHGRWLMDEVWKQMGWLFLGVVWSPELLD